MILLLILLNTIFAETVYVSEVVSFSSQFEDKAYSANQIIGKPSNFPEYGTAYTAWRPKDEFSVKGEFIEVKFSNDIIPKKVIVYENFNPGAISEIVVYNTDKSKSKTIFNSEQFLYMGETGNFRVIDINPPINFKVNSLKLTLATNRIPGYNEIDAIALTNDSTFKPNVKINLSKNEFELYDSENLGYNINSEYIELAPIINSTEDEIYFTRKSHPENLGPYRNQDIWHSKLDEEGRFDNAVLLDTPINDEYNNFAFSITPDNNSILLGNKYIVDGQPEQGISISHKTKDGWSFPEEIVFEEISKTGKFSAYQLASDGQTLLISIDNEESYGNNDLYVSFLNEDNKWSKPKNLGPIINTASYETSPFLAADGKTLYFSSSGFPGYGLNDIFYTKRLDDTWTNWSQPVNLGEKVNTSGWDAYFTIPASGNYAYFVSTENSVGNEDIFRIKLPTDLKPEDVVLIKGKVKDNEGNSLEAVIKYEDLTNGINLGKARSNPLDGKYQITLSKGKKYGIFAESKGYVSVNYNIDLDTLTGYMKLDKDIVMFPIKKGELIRINNIFFEFAKFDLLPESFPELIRLAKILKENPEINIQINGHTDDVGADDRNLKLSLERANSVKEFLVSKGIEKNRLKVKGFGKTQPLIDEKTDEARSQNRRVEILILD